MRSVLKIGSLVALSFVTLLVTDVEARSSSCPTCNLGTPKLTFQNIVTPQFNQNISGILNASRMQFAPRPASSGFHVNWDGTAQLPNTFQPIEVPDFVLPDWVKQLTPGWDNAAPGWAEALQAAQAYRFEAQNLSTTASPRVSAPFGPDYRSIAAVPTVTGPIVTATIQRN
ncbi:MAG: hypothetical protein A2Z97_08755 [Bdellovibrionales bacterium GWB1_52_6]|nr:MAG: hypothetical protein A2Z97_08755 [Bdellovibrionales bacterium GWB1_52_6]